VGYYATSLRDAIHDFKYRSATHLAAPLGRLMWHAVHHYFSPSDIDKVIPVPLHPRRLRSRGFNQSALLVRQWPAMGPADGQEKRQPWMAAGLLRRHRATLPQTGLNKAQRADNLKSAFSIPDKAMLKGKRVLLVDDVLTTGATANACAFVLKQAGAVRVDVLTLARAV
jgi:ComF family protein